MVILVAVLLVSVGSVRGDWPQLQGPEHNGISAESGLARSWPAGGPKVVWSVDVGIGYGGASVRDKKVYVLDRQEDERDVLRCLDLETGKALWQYSHKVPGRLSHNGSRSVPTLDEQRVYAVGPFGQVYCVDQDSHKLVWSLDLAKEYQAPQLRWGFSQSPLLSGDMVLLAAMSDEAGVLALDKATGKVLWQSEPVGGGSYASLVLGKLGGKQGVLFNAKNQLSCLDPKSGKVLWTYEGHSCRNPIPFPTVIGNDRIFLTGGYGSGSVMIQVTRSGEDYKITELFRLEERGSKIHPALYYEDHLYANFGKLVCFDPQGNPKWAEGDFVEGNLIIADGMVFILSSTTGELTLVEANSKAYKELARAKVLKGNDKEIFGPMALSEGKLIVRDLYEMKCLDVRAP